MKRFIKLICAVLVVLTLCLGLCSCKEMDEIREKRAEWGDELMTVIRFDGKEYKLLSPCEDLVVDLENGNNYGYVTLEEVPLLLTDQFGSIIKISSDREMIVCGHWQNDYECNKVYARSDLYEELEEAIENYELGWLCYQNNYYDYETQEFVTERILMPEALNEIVNKASELEGMILDEDDLPYGSSDVTLYFCDKSMRFVRENKYIRFTKDNFGKWYMIYRRAKDMEWVGVEISQEDINVLLNAIPKDSM